MRYKTFAGSSLLVFQRVWVHCFIAANCVGATSSWAASVDIIAHRGNSSVTPENTIVSINSAFDVGADHVESDIRLTSDGYAVLMHDSTVDRTTDGSGAIASMTLAQVQQLDAGSWFGSQFAGETVPTLADALVAANHRGRILLDIKAGGMGTAIQQALDQATAMTADTFTADDIWIWPGPNADYEANITNPQYLLGSLPSPAQWQTPGYFEGLLSQGVLGFDTGGGVTSPFADAAGNAGMVVSVYTINTELSMQSWIDIGVTAMETDFPEVLLNLLARQFLAGDLDEDEDVDINDWILFRSLYGEPLTGAQDDYLLGDLNLDGVHNILDFRDFRLAYDTFNVEGAFALILDDIPEPGTSQMLLIGALLLFRFRTLRF